MKNCILFWLAILLAMPSHTSGEPVRLWEDLSVNLPESPLRAFAVDPQNPNHIYVASTKALWETVDSGKTWRRLVSLSQHQFVVSETLSQQEAGGLLPFLQTGEGEKLFAQNSLSEEVRQRIIRENIFSGPTCVTVSPQNPAHIYLGTFDGLLISENAGKDWKKIQVGTGKKEQVIHFVGISRQDPQKIYVGTGDGLFISKEGGRKWKKDRTLLARETVSFVLEDPADPEKLCAATLGSGVFASTDGGKRWEKTVVGIGEAANQVRALVLSGEGENRKLYAATAGGLVATPSEKIKWEPVGRVSGMGENLSWVWALAPSGKILVAGERGLFGSEDAGLHYIQWSVGIRFANARQVAEGKDGSIFFLTPSGLFRSTIENSSPADPTSLGENPLWSRFRDEPSVQEVQRRAMRFAETHPEKIRAWRRGAKWRALLPRFQLGFGEDRNRRKFSDSDATVTQKFSSESNSEREVVFDEEAITAANFNGRRQIPIQTDTTTSENNITGETTESINFDEEVQRDRNTEFEIGAVWDLGNFLYNPEEVDISKEARELAELRDNILKEVTQFYFRRRHLQLELLTDQMAAAATPAATAPPERPHLDAADLLRKQLELEELTAQLDALTGGWFSEQL